MNGPIPDGLSRRTLIVIEIAIGVLMQRRDCTPAEARTLLGNAAEHRHLMVSELAERIVAERDLR